MGLSRSSLCALLPFLVASVSIALQPGDYSRAWGGDGTYYGRTEGGNCALRLPRPPMYANLVPVALNLPQYGDSGACGACISFSGNGVGSGGNPITGTRIGYIMDKCPECKPGDIDLGESGDGRWKVSWKFIPCPGNSLSFMFEGSNSFYGKIQPRGLSTPAKSMNVGGLSGSRTDDNFFIFQNGGGFSLPLRVEIVTVMGKKVSATLTQWPSDGVVYPNTQTSTGGFNLPAPRKTAPKPAPQKRPAAFKPSPRCVPEWKACTGPRNYWKTSRCCRNYICARAYQPGFVGRRCVPRNRKAFFSRKRFNRGSRYRKCVPKWGHCTGPRNWWKTSHCCGGYRCVRPRQRNFRGRRCEPPRRF